MYLVIYMTQVHGMGHGIIQIHQYAINQNYTAKENGAKAQGRPEENL